MSRPASAQLLFDEALRRNCAPRWETESGLFSFETEQGTRFVFCSKLNLNGHMAVTLCENKQFCHLALRRAGFATIPYIRSSDRAELLEFFASNRPVVRKPVSGRGGAGVVFVNREEDLWVEHPWAYLYERFVAGEEYRFLVLNGRIVNVEAHLVRPLPGAPWNKDSFNLSSDRWDKGLCEQALGIAKALGLRFGAVDFLVEDEGTAWILEVNSAPGLDSHPGQAVGLASLVLDEIIGL